VVSPCPRVRVLSYHSTSTCPVINSCLTPVCTVCVDYLRSYKAGAIVRNNVLVVLCDLCRTFTSVVDAYIPSLTLCIADENNMIRRHTLMILSQLLQEDYLKCTGLRWSCLNCCSAYSAYSALVSSLLSMVDSWATALTAVLCVCVCVCVCVSTAYCREGFYALQIPHCPGGCRCERAIIR